MKTTVAQQGRAALYVRLSKEDKDGKKAGVDSIAVQTEAGTEAIRTQGWDFDPKRHIFVDDDVSGRLVQRDGWGDMLATASRGEFSILVIRDLDRFARYEPARQMGTLIDLFDRGVRVWCYKDCNFVRLSGAESIVTYAKAIASEAYVETLRTNTIAAIDKRALAGQAIKQGGLGYEIEDQGALGKRWVIVPEQRERVLYISRIFIDTESVNATARRLNDEGFPTPWGAKWRANSVTALLQRPLYRGFYKYGDHIIPHPELRIWTPEMEEQIDALLARPAKPWSNAPRHLSTPFLRCAKCGGVLAATRSRKSGCWSLTCDRSRTKGCEGIGYRKEAEVDRALVAAASSVLDDGIWNRVKEILRAALEEQRQADNHEAEVDRLRRDVQGAERKVRNLTESVADADTKEERAPLMQALKDTSKRLEALRARLEAAKAAPTPGSAESILDAADAAVEDSRATLARGGVEARPAVAAVLGEEKLMVDRHPERKAWVISGRAQVGRMYVELFKGPSSTCRRRPRRRPRSPASPRARVTASA